MHVLTQQTKIIMGVILFVKQCTFKLCRLEEEKSMKYGGAESLRSRGRRSITYKHMVDVLL